MATTVEIVDAPPPAPPPAPRSEIKASQMQPPPQAPAPPKPGSARERMFADLEKKAKPGPMQSETPDPTPPPSQRPGAQDPRPDPTATTDPDEGEPGSAAATAEAADPAPGEKPKPATPPKAEGKKNPWKLVDEYKARAAKVEAELLEARKSAGDKTERERMAKEAEAVRKRNEELESEIRFVNYSKSQEYQERFEKPYDDMWHQAMNDMADFTVQDPHTGEKRPMEPKDLLDLVNKGTSEAMEQAMQLYGPLANEVMGYRKEIRKLFDAKHNALEQARKASTDRELRNREFATKFQQELNDTVNEHWSKANETLLADEKYGKCFQPVEGDENINQRLAKGYQLVDRAMRENPRDPNLTAEQRKAITQRHAALRHRAAAFGRVFYELNQARDRISELESRLESYEQSEPSTEGGGGTPQANGTPMTARQQVMAALAARAK